MRFVSAHAFADKSGTFAFDLYIRARSTVVICRIRIAEARVRFSPGPPMITQKRELGNKGEDEAVRYLAKKGYSVVARNWATKFGEIDIIAKKRDGAYVFVEVKTVRAGGYVRPEENITYKKLQRFLRTIEMYLRAARASDQMPWQMDAITVTIDEGGVYDIKHWENINIF